MNRASKVKRFLALTLTLIVVLPLSLVAARWQLNRHLEREATNNLVENSLTSPLTAIDSVTDFDELQLWHRVSLEVTWQVSEAKLWRKQPLDGSPGFIWLVPGKLPDNSTVVGQWGWVAATGAEPEISVEVLSALKPTSNLGFLKPLPICDGKDPADLPSQQTNCPTTLSSDLYLIQMAEAPGDLTTLPLPQADAGPHLGYVGQWLLIGLTAIITYIALLRRLNEGDQASETKSA